MRWFGWGGSTNVGVHVECTAAADPNPNPNPHPNPHPHPPPSFETPDRKTIFGFARLRLAPTAGAGIFSELNGAALVRELHVYGTLIMVNKKKKGVAPEKSKVRVYYNYWIESFFQLNILIVLF